VNAPGHAEVPKTVSKLADPRRNRFRAELVGFNRSKVHVGIEVTAALAFLINSP
jgi:hypothetical protein